jgi:hypothetical protein
MVGLPFRNDVWSLIRTRSAFLMEAASLITGRKTWPKRRSKLVFSISVPGLNQVSRRGRAWVVFGCETLSQRI